MASSAQGTQPQQRLPQQGKGPSTSGQPTYQPIGVNNPPASYNPVAPVPNGQSPYNMNMNANSNMMQNQNTVNTNDYSTMLPANGLTQGPPKQWYPGMYPSTSPQFGTNPYAPQTFNVQGHPGHNPSTYAAVEPNMPNTAMSNQGQFVQQMASGGSSGPSNGAFGYMRNRAEELVNGKSQSQPNNFTYTDTARQWAGPVSTNAPSYQTENPVDTFSNMKGFGMRPQQPGMGAKGPGMGIVGLMARNNPNFNRALGLDNQPTQQNIQPREVVQQVSPAPQVYAPQYAQYAPIRTNIDSYGNPLMNNGGLASIRR